MGGLLFTLSPRPRGVVFDYGNTLIPFGRREVDRIEAACAEFLREELRDADPGSIRARLRETVVGLHREREATGRESDPRDVFRRTRAALGAPPPGDGFAKRGVEALRAAFVAAVRIGAGTPEVLEDLGRGGLRVGLLSNYSLGPAIRDSLAGLGIADRFHSVVVSADLGLVKPDRRLFELSARELDLAPEEILFVGDNGKADIAGAAAAGMRTAFTRQHLAGAHHFEHPGENDSDAVPDLVLDHLTELTRGGD